MSLATNISSAFTRVGTECKSIRTLVNGNASTLNGLTTTAKGNLVLAINELDAAIDSIIASGSATNLDALTDVTLTGPTTGHILRYNGTVWANGLGTTFFDAAGSSAAAQAASQPLDADLTALAALAGQTAYGRGLLTLADGTALAGLIPGGTFQAADSDLTSIAALATTTYGRALLTLADQNALVALLPSYQPLDADLTAIAALAGQTAYGRSFLTMADAAAMRSLINVDPAGAAAAAQAASQPLDSDLTSIAALATTAYGRSLLTPTDAATARALLGVVAPEDTDAKQSVRWATTANTDIDTTTTTLTNAQMLAAFGGSSNATTDFPIGARLLIKDDGQARFNGIYVVTANTGSTVSFARTADMDTWAKVPGASVFVEGVTLGAYSVLAGTGWMVPGPATGVINTQGMAWQQFTAFDSGAKQTVRAATTANITLSGTQTVDTVALAVNDRVLVKNQTAAATNGIYSVQSGTWTRVLDLDNNYEAFGAMVTVKEGTQSGTTWQTTFKQGDTFNTTAMNWVKVGSPTNRLPVKYTTTTDVGGSYNATGGSTGRGLLNNPGGFNLAGAYSPGDRVLVKDQSTPAQNGIYVILGGGTQMERATDADADGELTTGTVVYVTGGTGGAVLQNTAWVLTTTGTITVGGATGSAMAWGPIGPNGATVNGDLTGDWPDLQLAPGVVDITTINTALKVSGSAVDASEALRALGYTTGKAMPGVARLDQIALPTAAVNVNGQKITGLADTPTAGTDAVNKNYADGLLAANDAMVFKGGIDCSGSPNYPAANAGWVYRVTVAGKIGGASGPNVEVNDTLTCLVDSTAAGTQATVGANWLITQTNIDGAVTGPVTSTAGNLASFNGATGKVIQDTGVAISTDGNLTSNSNAKVPTEAAVRTYAQPYDADLTAIAGLASAANKMLYATGTNNWALADLSAFGRSLVAAADATAARAAGILDVYSRAEIGDPTTDFVATFNAALV